MKLRREPESIERKKEDSYDNEYEMKSMLPQVKSAVKENVTSDYTLAILNKDEKEFVIENYGNAEYAKEIIKRFGQKGYRYQWDNETKDWVKNPDGSYKKVLISKEERNLIEEMAKRTFTFFMIQSHLIAILNRNKVENHMVNILGKWEEEAKKVEYDQEDKSVLQKIRDYFNGRGVDDEAD